MLQLEDIQRYSNINVSVFQHIPHLSCYNSNFYAGFGADILYAESDDDNTTLWYIARDLSIFGRIETDVTFNYIRKGLQLFQLGYSQTSDNITHPLGEHIIFMTEPYT